MADSTEKRSSDSTAMADNGAFNAYTEVELVKEQDEHKSTVKELSGVLNMKLKKPAGAPRKEDEQDCEGVSNEEIH